MKFIISSVNYHRFKVPVKTGTQEAAGLCWLGIAKGFFSGSNELVEGAAAEEAK